MEEFPAPTGAVYAMMCRTENTERSVANPAGDEVVAPVGDHDPASRLNHTPHFEYGVFGRAEKMKGVRRHDRVKGLILERKAFRPPVS